MDFVRLEQAQGFYIKEPFIYYLLAFFVFTFLVGASVVLLPEGRMSSSLAASARSLLQLYFLVGFIAAVFFGPMFSVKTTDSVRGVSVIAFTGDYFIGPTVDCVREGKLPLGKDCASEGEMKGSTFVGDVMSWASILAAVAAVLAVPGLLPFIGRITSVVTLAAGLSSLAAMGLFMTTIMGSEAGLGGVQWGAYLAAGMALLTTISGLSGMRGR